jgi:phospholipid/cholesterol/gamma-HCH transport system substrate-binding protein
METEYTTGKVPEHTMVKVSIFSCAMLLVLAALVLIFGNFRFSPSAAYHADFGSVSRLKAGQDVRIAGVRVGKVKHLAVRDGHVNVTFDVDKEYQLYTSTRAVIRYQDLVGARYLEIVAGPGELRKLPPGGTIAVSNTEPALDLDALLGGLRPVLSGLDGDKINEISSAVIELLQGKGATLADMLSSTGSFTSTLAARDELIGHVIDHLNTVLTTIDTRGAQLDTTIDELQRLVATLSAGREPIAGAIAPLASAQADLTAILQTSRRPLQRILENVRPLAAELNERQNDVNAVIDPLADAYLRMNALGAYGSFFNIYFCTVKLKINGPAGSDIYIPLGGTVNPNKGRCSW